jgi:hypothetical protein
MQYETNQQHYDDGESSTAGGPNQMLMLLDRMEKLEQNHAARAPPDHLNHTSLTSNRSHTATAHAQYWWNRDMHSDLLPSDILPSVGLEPNADLEPSDKIGLEPSAGFKPNAGLEPIDKIGLEPAAKPLTQSATPLTQSAIYCPLFSVFTFFPFLTPLITLRITLFTAHIS